MKAMRAVLSLLLCFVLLEAQALAAHTHGGGSGVSTNVIGTYAGVLVPTTTSSTDTTGTGTSTSTGTTTDSTLNTLALFSLVVPDTGVSTGAFLVFSSGRVFTGNIIGIADPDFGAIRAVLQATFDFTLAVPITGTDGSTTISDVDITATATGNMTATVLQASLGSLTLGRITGTAHLDIDFGQVDATTLEPVIARTLDFTVDGFKQSATALPLSDFTTTGGGTGGGNGG